MEEDKLKAETALSKFSYALDELENTLRPVLSAVDVLRSSGHEEELDASSRARMHISLCYTVNSLFCMYLRTQGVDPAAHPVSEEIANVQDAFMRMRKVEAGRSADHQPAPDRERRRHIVNAKKRSEKLASLVFPEEVDLLNALRGKSPKQNNTPLEALNSEENNETNETSDSESDEETTRKQSKANDRSSSTSPQGDTLRKSRNVGEGATESDDAMVAEMDSMPHTQAETDEGAGSLAKKSKTKRKKNKDGKKRDATKRDKKEDRKRRRDSKQDIQKEAAKDRATEKQEKEFSSAEKSDRKKSKRSKKRKSTKE